MCVSRQVTPRVDSLFVSQERLMVTFSYYRIEKYIGLSVECRVLLFPLSITRQGKQPRFYGILTWFYGETW